jgi:hypothetical protein
VCERLDEFDAIDRTEVVVVTFTRARNLRGYQRRFAEPLFVVSDESLVLYRALGFGRGSVARVWGPRAAKKYVQLLRQGKQLERPKNREDTLQLGGNVVIDAEGRLRWIYPGEGPDDRPTVDMLLEALRTPPPIPDRTNPRRM